MQIVIVGGGRVGTTLAEKLSREGHDVTLVEQDPRAVAELSDALDVRVSEGNGATAEALRRAGAEEAELLLATSDSDETNFVAGRVAASLFEVPSVVVRLRDPDHEEAFYALSRGAPGRVVCVNPEAAAVEKIAALLEVPNTQDVSAFMDGELLVAGFRIGQDSEFAERPVSDMRLFFAETPSLVAAIQRGDQAMVPHGEETLRAGDVVHFAIARSDLPGVLQLLGAEEPERRRILVAGATRLGIAVVRRLRELRLSVSLLEADRAVAQRAAERLPGTVHVENGVPTSQRFLEELEIERVHTFVAVTPDHETNLVAGLLAKKLGAKRAFALVDNPALADLIGETSIDAPISPRLLAIGLIKQHVPRGGNVISMAAILGDRVEVIEAEAVKGSRVVSGPLATIGLPRGVLVAALRRSGALRVPRGTDRVEPGDRLLLIAATEATKKLFDFLRGPEPRAGRTGCRARKGRG